MSDLISRQDAIDAWDKLSKRGRTEFDQVLMTLPSSEPNTKCIAQIRIDRDDLEDLVNEKVNEIVNMMSEPNTEWILCSERLPETLDDMLVTDGETMAVGYYRPDAKAWDSTSFAWLENRSEPPYGIKTVVAWMPLPPAYKR